ncbi:MAG: sigma-70 family RNA polymerase sigma factor [Bacteroidales bacterium]
MDKNAKREEFLGLISRHQHLIKKVAAIYYKNPEDQEDAFQEILVSLWKAYPTFEGRSKISTWIYRVALNTVLTNLRKATNRVYHHQTDINIPENIINKEEQDLSEEISVLYKAIKHLSDIEKAIIMLYMEEKTYDDIADIMGMTKTNVGVKISRIKKKLKKLYKKMENGY